MIHLQNEGGRLIEERIGRSANLCLQEGGMHGVPYLRHSGHRSQGDHP